MLRIKIQKLDYLKAKFSQSYNGIGYEKYTIKLMVCSICLSACKNTTAQISETDKSVKLTTSVKETIETEPTEI